MNEVQNQNPFQPEQAAQTGLVLQEQHAALVADWQTAGHPEDPTYTASRQDLETRMTAQAYDVFSATGVEPTAADRPTNVRTVESDLELAIDVAREAATLGFSLEGTDKAATEQAQHLIVDYDAFIEPRMAGRKDELPPDYDKRQKAKLLLVESSARDLARRAGIGNPVLDKATVDQIKTATGVGFAELRHGYPGPVRLVMRTPSVKPEANPHYMGPEGTPIHVSGIGYTAVAGYRYGKPVIRDKAGNLQMTYGRY